MQLVQSRVAQEYNWRRKRDGAFWHDRYHATAVDGGVHALRCATYIAMNMVRAGVVRHPSEWRWCGCREILDGRQRYRLIDRHALAEALGIEETELANVYRDRITYLLGERDAIREPEWTETVAVGGESFVESVKQALRDVRATWQVMADGHAGGQVCLKEAAPPYNAVLGGKNAPLSIVFRPFNDASR